MNMALMIDELGEENRNLRQQMEQLQTLLQASAVRGQQLRKVVVNLTDTLKRANTVITVSNLELAVSRFDPDAEVPGGWYMTGDDHRWECDVEAPPVDGQARVVSASVEPTADAPIRYAWTVAVWGEESDWQLLASGDAGAALPAMNEALDAQQEALAALSTAAEGGGS